MKEIGILIYVLCLILCVAGTVLAEEATTYAGWFLALALLALAGNPWFLWVLR